MNDKKKKYFLRGGGSSKSDIACTRFVLDLSGQPG